MVVTAVGKGVSGYWHLVGRDPRMLLNILQCTGHLLTIKNYQVQNIKMKKSRNPVLKDDLRLTFWGTQVSKESSQLRFHTLSSLE